MRKLYAIVFVLFLKGIACAQFPQVEMLNEPIHTYLYTTEVQLEELKLYWPNGKLKREFVVVDDSMLLRKDYYKSGHLQIGVTGKPSLGVDSSYTENFKTGDFELTVSERYYLSLEGRYTAYEDTSVLIVHTTGYFCQSYICGKWVRELPEGKVEVHYDNFSRLNGPARQYYPDSQQLKWEGQYGLVDEIFIEEDIVSGEIIRVEGKVVAPVGVWKHYAENGDLIEEIKY